MSEEQLHEQIRQTQDKSRDGALRVRQIAEQTRAVGAATLTSLHRQGEQLKNIQNSHKEIEANLTASDRILRGMESWRGAAAEGIRGFFSKKKSSSAAPAAHADGCCSADAPAVTPPPAGAAVASSGSSVPTARSAAASAEWSALVQPSSGGIRTADEETDDHLGAISGLLGDMRLQAEAMNTEMKAQASTIDAMGAQAERNADHMSRTNMRTKALR